MAKLKRADEMKDSNAIEELGGDSHELETASAEAGNPQG